MHVEENKPLAPFTTFGIGGAARWFAQAQTEDDVAEAVAWARTRNAPLFVLGGGSNLLVSDAGFDGLVLHIALRGITLQRAESNAILSAAAGEDWDRCVQRSVEENCAGLECLAGIPGTVGGTPVQNVGAYGQEVASAIERVRAFDTQTDSFVEFSAAECAFAYRRSRFNSTDRGRYIVTSVDYRVTPGGAPTLRYADLQRAFAAESKPKLTEVVEAVRRIRQSKGMLLVEGDADCRSAGSFFKNPVVTAEQVREIGAATQAEPPRFPAGAGAENAGRVKVPAAWLIERAGFGKGFTRGRAAISSRHTLALTNRGEATAAEVLALAEEIRSAVELRFGLRLEQEPVLLGFES
ncbi:MAG: UDP-N-acetylmuramate dehydrogenase [Acidobacteriaceae bacterium]|nr:UDP-N-acetylmuramate dehydrogenase [Acidobacteriaceae bacterium]